MTTRTAGPDYWFVDPAYANVDRLAEDECPMDDVQEGKDHEAMAAEWAKIERQAATIRRARIAMHLGVFT